MGMGMGMGMGMVTGMPRGCRCRHLCRCSDGNVKAGMSLISDAPHDRHKQQLLALLHSYPSPKCRRLVRHERPEACVPDSFERPEENHSYQRLWDALVPRATAPLSVEYVPNVLGSCKYTDGEYRDSNASPAS